MARWSATITQWFDTVTGLQVSDLSSTNKLVTDWLYVGPGWEITETAVWPATGAPVGTFGVESSNEAVAGHAPATARTLTGDALDLATLVPAPVQPAGTAGRMSLAFKAPGAYLRHTYQRTSGGTGSSLVVNIHAAVRE
jgi:hypothetical protein